MAALGQPFWVRGLLARPERQSLLVAGNLEARESVLSFKDIKSLITIASFDEGQWVGKGTMLAQLDDLGYSQQAVIAAQTATGAAPRARRRIAQPADRQADSGQRSRRPRQGTKLVAAIPLIPAATL